MNNVSYKIVSKYVPAVHIRNHQKDDLSSHRLQSKNTTVSRSIDTECIPSEYVSDGQTVIKLSDLVKKLREHKEIKLVPLSLSYNNNITEYRCPQENEAFSSVTINVCVESKSDSMTPSQIVCETGYSEYTYIFRRTTKGFIAEQNILIQLYPDGKNRNVIEITTDLKSVRDLKEDSWYTLIPKSIFGHVKKLSFYGVYDQKEYLTYELENNNLQQNQKITVLNYL